MTAEVAALLAQAPVRQAPRIRDGPVQLRQKAQARPHEQQEQDVPELGQHEHSAQAQPQAALLAAQAHPHEQTQWGANRVPQLPHTRGVTPRPKTNQKRQHERQAPMS